MKSNGLIYLIIAGMLAIIGFLVYFFFFRKKLQNSTTSDVMISDSIPTNASNPINPQSVGNPVYNPVITMPMEGTQTSSTKTFDSMQYEVLKTDGNALTQRTNNPGALFWDGTTQWQGLNQKQTKSGQIIYFDTVDYGIRAQCMTLKNYSKKHGINTLNALTARYAPLGHGNNNPVAYAQTLATYLGIQPTDKIDLDANRNLLAGVAYFIHRVEAGYFWVERSKFIEWSTKV